MSIYQLVRMSLNSILSLRPEISYRRDWSKYSQEKLRAELCNYHWDWYVDDVQSNWNKIEEILVRTTDIIANRLSGLNNLIKLDWLNKSLVSFKLKLKELLLTNN